ncbi:MAG: CopZ family metallochaperone [Acidiferrobacteraceae bacterium]
MSQTTLRITGMTCGHCVAAVTRALRSVPGVESAEVNLEQKRGVVTGNADAARLVQAVKGEGYDAEVVS